MIQYCRQRRQAALSGSWNRRNQVLDPVLTPGTIQLDHGLIMSSLVANSNLPNVYFSINFVVHAVSFLSSTIFWSTTIILVA